MKSDNIQAAAINEIIRVFWFVLYYLVLIGLGIFILWGSFSITYYGIFEAIPQMTSIRGIVFLLLSLIGLCLLSVMVGIYLIKPLFSFTKNFKQTRLEITEHDCPELFALIYEIADQTNCQRPKHVYLSTDVNACVFYDTSFWSIFFPVKKNLEIGLGLFEGMNIGEIKSILAHEFGHFSQKTMKVGSSVSITNTVLYNLVYSKDSWDKFVDDWCLSDTTSIIRFFGILTRLVTNWIRSVTTFVFSYVQVGYLRLSRYMEYDADNISCKIYGSKNLISALCKLEILGKKDEYYQTVLSSMLDENKLPKDYFSAQKIFYNLLPNKEIPKFSFVDVLTKKTNTYNLKSKVNFKNIWASHPSLGERIANATKQHCDVDNEVHQPAWDLISPEIRQKVSDHLLAILRDKNKENVESLSDEQFNAWVHDEIRENFMDERLRPFFSDSLFQINLDEIDYPIPSESPFTEDNAFKIAEFKVARDDWQILKQIKEKQIKVKKVRFDGEIYTPKQIPLDAVRKEVDNLYQQVEKINSDIFYYIKSRISGEEQQVFADSYRALFYAQYIGHTEISGLLEARNVLLEELNMPIRRDESEYERLCSDVCDFESHLKNTIKNLQVHFIATYLEDDSIRDLKNYLNIKHNNSQSINKDSLQEMFGLVDYIINLRTYLFNVSLRRICGCIVNVMNS